jgi:predicted nucleic acid-binding protein
MPSNIESYSPGINFVQNVYLDPNLLINCINTGSAHHTIASQLLADLFTKEINLFITNLVVDEFCWILLILYYRRDHGGRDKLDQVIKNNRSIISRYHPQISADVQAVLSFPRLNLISHEINSREIVDEAVRLMGAERLTPRDSFHLAFIMKRNIEGIVTQDRDFDNLGIAGRNLTIYKY